MDVSTASSTGLTVSPGAITSTSMETTPAARGGTTDAITTTAPLQAFHVTSTSAGQAGATTLP